MYLDTIVIAGIGTVLLMVGFMGAFAAFVWRDSKKNKDQGTSTKA